MKIRTLKDAISFAKKLWNNKDEVRDIFNQSGKKASEHQSEMKTGLFADVQTLREMVSAYLAGSYKFSKRTVVFVVAGLLYFISPIDLVPDFILGLGFIDDAAVLALVVKRLRAEIALFRKSKVQNNNQTIIID
jgi:uncharacterized membrane protein YkvA (DUF1232 family)